MVSIKYSKLALTRTYSNINSSNKYVVGNRIIADFSSTNTILTSFTRVDISLAQSGIYTNGIYNYDLCYNIAYYQPVKNYYSFNLLEKVYNLNGNISSPVGASSDSVGFTTPPSMPDYSRAYSALGGAESVSNLRDQLLGMGISEDIIGSAFAAYYAPETSNEGIKSIFSQDGYRNGGFLNRGGR